MILSILFSDMAALLMEKSVAGTPSWMDLNLRLILLPFLAWKECYWLVVGPNNSILFTLSIWPSSTILANQLLLLVVLLISNSEMILSMIKIISLQPNSKKNKETFLLCKCTEE